MCFVDLKIINLFWLYTRKCYAKNSLSFKIKIQLKYEIFRALQKDSVSQ